jgi:hypothetical protein
MLPAKSPLSVKRILASYFPNKSIGGGVDAISHLGQYSFKSNGTKAAVVLQSPLIDWVGEIALRVSYFHLVERRDGWSDASAPTRGMNR